MELLVHDTGVIHVTNDMGMAPLLVRGRLMAQVREAVWHKLGRQYGTKLMCTLLPLRWNQTSAKIFKTCLFFYINM
jgi:hypothetical protein